jgi:hypothetical protein
MKLIIFSLLLFTSVIFSYPSYTGYSSAPGSKGTCASSCHGSGTGTITVSGFPASYEPSTTYRVVVKHSGGNKIYNFNASTRIGTTTNVAGTFAAGTNATIYNSGEPGIHASSNLVDSVVFFWTSPASITDPVTLYLAGLQGSKNGANTRLVNTASYTITSVNVKDDLPKSYSLLQNYPNPFNPSTTIKYALPKTSNVELKIYNILGKEIKTLVSGEIPEGYQQAVWDGKDNYGENAPSGIYIYTLTATSLNDSKKFEQSSKMIMLK